MFSVFIAEDEPASLEFIKNIIAKKCPDFHVVGEAYDGAEALEKLSKHPADVLISDVEMDDVNGIELVTKLNQMHPQTQAIIVSGYSEFSYIQGALRAQAVDYILKPINIRQIVEVLSEIADKLRRIYWDMQLSIWRDCISRNVIDRDAVSYYMRGNLFYLSLIHRGGPTESGGVEMMGHEIAYTMPESERWVLSGRNASELLVISERAPDSLMTESLIEIFGEGLYCTTVFAGPFRPEKIYPGSIGLARQLDQLITIGVSQTLNSAVLNEKSLDCREFLRTADYYLRSANIMGFRDEIVKNFGLWETGGFCALQVGNALEQLFARVISHSTDSEPYDYSTPLAQALKNANSMGELMSMVWDIFARMLDIESVFRQNTRDLFVLIEQYLSRHYMEPMSLQGVCNRFNISQTYLSRLFKKYKNASFNDYLTAIRIQKAKEIISGNKDLKLKDVAEMVGYPDSSYFSKVFRQHVGCNPSKYGGKSASFMK